MNAADSRLLTLRKLELIRAELPSIDWIVDDARVKRLSQDYFWFSPVLKRLFDDKQADAVARPRDEDEIRQVVGACARHGVPLTVRGGGTGNYAQSTPLNGGLILDLSRFNKLLWVRNGVGRAQAGIRLSDFDQQSRPDGWELRCLPSTFRMATLGGLFGGGFGGVGSITYGPLGAPGNVLAIKAMTVEAEPRIVELSGPEALLLHHGYGTNGIVLELEVALAPAHPWLENIVVFEDFDRALDCAQALAQAPGIIKKSVTFLAAPIPGYMEALKDFLPEGCHALMVIVAEFNEAAMKQIVGEFGGRITYRQDTEQVQATRRTLVEYAWNHTTMHALKVDRGLTYIQCSFQPGRNLEQVRQLEKLLGGEVLMHVEFLRLRDGTLTCNGLPIIRYTTDERLNEIMQIYRDHGVGIANPHVYVVEDGKQGQINPAVVMKKLAFDPHGLLNPGKLRGWEIRDQIIAAQAQA
ncbi:MAG: FAD-binding oxidoreductase [Pigmentiphaga sp.]|uniref:FAD-binding oxidoreductase n=1 Tax=Pigmentiphaga sp. TaxID=1977564 RepID=UPI0029B73DA8|nr:FAD-binding oxidoreductase [Pigmentiphaga sp.]MDX3906120.1 FAD-binding oxidoreductase [Pigmentiphaga sp.]